MPKKSNQKLRLVYMKEILERHTDEEHGIAREDFERYLSHRGVDAFGVQKYNKKEARKSLKSGI